MRDDIPKRFPFPYVNARAVAQAWAKIGKSVYYPNDRVAFSLQRYDITAYVLRFVTGQFTGQVSGLQKAVERRPFVHRRTAVLSPGIAGRVAARLPGGNAVIGISRLVLRLSRGWSRLPSPVLARRGRGGGLSTVTTCYRRGKRGFGFHLPRPFLVRRGALIQKPAGKHPPFRFFIIFAAAINHYTAITVNNYRKTDRLWLAALLVLLMLGGGCKHTPAPPADLTPEAWLAQDAEGCLRHYTRSFTRLSGEVGYDSVRRLYSGLMRRLPEHPAGDADSVASYMGQVLAYYNNTLLLSPRDSVDAHRPYREAVRLPDSLLRSPHRLYRGTLRYELLTYGGQLHMMAHEGSTADSMARALLALPPLQDHARAARVYHVMAWTAGFYCPQVDIAIALEERAVAACRAGGRLVADGAVFSRMGYFYRLAGRYEEAVGYIQEAIDYYIDSGLRQAGGDLRRIPPAEAPDASDNRDNRSATAPAAAGNRRGRGSRTVYPFPVERTPDGRITSETAYLFTSIVRAYGDLASLYATLGLYDKALEANRIALHYSRQADGILLPGLCRLRSDYLSAAGQPKASLAWLDSAYAAHVRRRDEEVTLLRIRRTRIRQVVEAYPDSAVHYLGEARTHLADSAAVSYKSLPGVYELYGMVLANCPGRERDAIPYLEEAFRGYTVRHHPLGSEPVAAELLKIYARTGQYDKLGKLYPRMPPCATACGGKTANAPRLLPTSATRRDARSTKTSCSRQR